MSRRDDGVDGHDVDGPSRAAGLGGTRVESREEPRPSRPPKAPVAVLAPDKDPEKGNGRHRPGPPPPPAPPTVPEGSGPGRRKPRKVAAFLLLTIASALVLVAVGVGGYPFFTDFQAARHQKALKNQLDQTSKDGADRTKLLEQYKNRNFAIGSPVTRILIPKLGVETVVVEGTSDETLADCPRHH